MRTTLAIDDGLLATAKHRARQRHCTLGQLVEASLQQYLSQEPVVGDAPPLPIFTGKLGVRPGIDFADPRTALRILDDEDVADSMSYFR